MKKRSFNFIVFSVLLTSFFLSAALPAGWGKYRVTVKNNTHTKVYIKLQAPKAYYYFKLNPGTKKNYTIKAATYKATFWGCYSKKVIKKWELNRKYKILFPVCNARDHGNEMGVLRILFPEYKGED
ncbi:MAG: hypothetical protein JW908_13500 [Anaerolineales bacterium]|nr:hypothetical protein [Anaerolineales bacterium]